MTVTVTDNGTGTRTDSETFTITVVDTNVAPVLAAIGNKSVNEGAALSFTQVGPGRYRAITSADQPGVYLAQIAAVGAVSRPRRRLVHRRRWCAKLHRLWLFEARHHGPTFVFVVGNL